MKISYVKDFGLKCPTFASLYMGDVFLLVSDANNDDPFIYMVTDEYCDINAVCLNDGETCAIDDKAEVIRLDASLNISRKTG